MNFIDIIIDVYTDFIALFQTYNNPILFGIIFAILFIVAPFMFMWFPANKYIKLAISICILFMITTIGCTVSNTMIDKQDVDDNITIDKKTIILSSICNYFLLILRIFITCLVVYYLLCIIKMFINVHKDLYSEFPGWNIDYNLKLPTVYYYLWKCRVLGIAANWFTYKVVLLCINGRIIKNIISKVEKPSDENEEYKELYTLMQHKTLASHVYDAAKNLPGAQLEEYPNIVAATYTDWITPISENFDNLLKPFNLSEPNTQKYHAVAFVLGLVGVLLYHLYLLINKKILSKMKTVKTNQNTLSKMKTYYSKKFKSVDDIGTIIKNGNTIGYVIITTVLIVLCCSK